jgi:hypothetical protein
MPTLIDGHAVVTATYHMGPVAEEAACYQTLGFCEGMLASAGARNVSGMLGQLSWLGAPHTALVLNWDSNG